MLIPEGLRQEHMPMMVYALCRLVEKEKNTEDDIIKILSVTNEEKDENSIRQTGSVLGFAKKAGLVYVDKGYLCTDLAENEVESPVNFSRAILKRIEVGENEKFISILKWLLWKGAEFEAAENHSSVRRLMLDDPLIKQINVTEDYTHGFLFWAEFLGLITHSIQPMGGYNYSIENILIAYIRDNYDKLKSHGNMPFLEFLNMISPDLFFIQLCYANTEVCCSLSFALRVMEKMGIIEIEDKDDGSMTWHLEKSNTFIVGNSFTNIKVR